MSSGRTTLLALFVAELAVACGESFQLDDADAGASGSGGTSATAGGPTGASTGSGGDSGSSATATGGGFAGSLVTGTGGGDAGASSSGGAGGKGGAGGSAGLGGRSGAAGLGGSGGAGGVGGSAGKAGAAGSGIADAGPDGSAIGTACMVEGQCGSGHCVDGRCCESACQTPCYACNLPGALGFCRPLTGVTDPNPVNVCASPQTCCSGLCRDTSSVDSCGSSCQRCTAPSDRAVPTCNGTSCGFTCKNADPKCSDGSCSRLSWDFESGGLDGITVLMSSGQPLAVRSFGGTMALAADVAQLNVIPEVSFTLPLCVSGNVNLSTKTLTFRVYFDGTPASTYNFFIQASVPTPQTNAYLDQLGGGTGTWVPFSSPMSKSTFSSAATAVTIQLGSLGGTFTGTIWIDDIKIQ